MEIFPSMLERTVASALLLLSGQPPVKEESNSSETSLWLRKSKSSSWCSSKLELGMSESRSCSCSCLSTLTIDNSSSSAEARAHEMKLKVVRKIRSKPIKKSDHRKTISGDASTSTASASSCVTSGSSGGGAVVSSARKEKKVVVPALNSAPMRRRAEGIMRLLAYGSASEVIIRQLLGDSPDTSKALRMLLKKEEIKRSGAGGRWDPYIYKIA